jgi:hypothetical protein
MKTLNRTAGYLVAAGLTCLLAGTALAAQVQMIRPVPSSGRDLMTLTGSANSGATLRARFLGERSAVAVELYSGGDSSGFADVFGLNSGGAIIPGCRASLQGPGPTNQVAAFCTGVVRYIGILTVN